MKRIILKPGEEKRILAGHPWVYDNEVARIVMQGPGSAGEKTGRLEPGELADVESSRKEYLGRAFVNPRSKILARIYSPSKEGVDKGFFKRRIREALARRGFDLRRESARIVFGEADFLPGLIVDRFVGWPLEAAEAAVPERPLGFDMVEAALGPPSSWLSVQFLSYGMDCRREEILAALEEVLGNWSPAAAFSADPQPGPGLKGPLGIVEKPAAKIRDLEGLAQEAGLLRGEIPPGGVLIFENGFPFGLSLDEGQKTGHYLDQRENRLRAAAFAGQGRVLDVCAYTGGFGIHAARYGAASVSALDASAAALEMARRNARLNGVEDRFTTLEGDVFELLRSYERDRERFDLIILDPPAFAKSRSALEGALRGYKDLNLRALRLLKPGGVLVSCSCSQALEEGRFRKTIAEAAQDAERRLLLLDFRYQSQDHPILVGYDESLYLKCAIYRGAP